MHLDIKDGLCDLPLKSKLPGFITDVRGGTVIRHPSDGMPGVLVQNIETQVFAVDICGMGVLRTCDQKWAREMMELQAEKNRKDCEDEFAIAFREFLRK